MLTRKEKRIVWGVALLLFWGFIGRHIFDYFYAEHKRGQFLAKYPTVATIGNGGTSEQGRYYGIRDMHVSDTRGGGASFGYGATSGYPGGSASIGIGVPKHIKGYWARDYSKEESKTKKGYQTYYRIDADIDSELAKKKIETLQNYYKNFPRKEGVMQVIVNKEEVYVFFTLKCFSKVKDCTSNENADPNGYVVKSPKNLTDVVVLFEGKGEVSSTPFKGTSFDRKY
ncbi:hypothetical protein [Vibrio algivorus]|uniref:DUF2931 family protein n=1 Tax=Vibrio algivorus TaxID=1667024 RepID=A0A557NTX3_9VIBR|nr:hypothetical protein [Vibrio algivorus]TVO31878.1 hypothetical protein FOF44_17600 [Vibrio algivorus]